MTTPAAFLSHLAPNSQSAIFYKSQASKELLGREAIVPTGGILGGGSSINAMMYTRAQAIDYDSWDMEGWDFKSVLPSFKRVRSSLYRYSGGASQLSRADLTILSWKLTTSKLLKWTTVCTETVAQSTSHEAHGLRKVQRMT